MLDAALLEDSEELYDIKNMRFKNRAFSDNVVRLKTERYSPFFAKTIINLL